MLIEASTTSLVVPGISVTMARSVPEHALSRLDFPTFGLPTIATCSDELMMLPSATVAVQQLKQLL